MVLYTFTSISLKVSISKGYNKFGSCRALVPAAKLEYFGEKTLDRSGEKEGVRGMCFAYGGKKKPL
jgi:hypothetical protein